ncbi:MAG: TIGR01459 family HAD-type hydrolase [Pseudomonadota bacterium]
MLRLIDHLSEVSDQYDALFVDLWGCVHNGLEPFSAAVKALQAYRASGGIVILVTNAPRHRASVALQLEKIGVAEDCYDDIATSGDSARAAMFTGAVGTRVYFMGQRHDEAFFDPLALIEDPVEITRVPLSEAEGIVCCGPFDPHADPSESRADLLYAKQKGMKLLCANPDIVVDRGAEREWCAGKLAEMYTEMGGTSLYFGKPHPPIYDLARLRLEARRSGLETSRIRAIGDGIHTDIKGSLGEDIDSLFITGGLAAEETGTDQQPTPEKLDAFVAQTGIAPTYAIGFLR